MPYIVIRRIDGGPNPDLIPGMRLGDAVDETFVSMEYVKWFGPDELHLAPPEPEAKTPEVNQDKDHIETAPVTTSPCRAKDDGGSNPSPIVPVHEPAKKTAKKKTRKNRKGR